MKRQLPLAGVRVCDLTWVISGPQATRLLADLGAEVIKVEGRDRGDQVRRMTFNPRVFASRGMFFYFNRNKLDVTLDLASPEGRAKFAELVTISDVVIENFSAHVMKRWGFDYEGLAAQFVDLAQFETACSLLGTYILDFTVNGRSLRRPGMPAGNRSTHPAAAPHGVYRCAGEDRWIAIAVFSDEEWARFRAAIGDPVWATDQRYATIDGRLNHQQELDGQVEGWTSERSGEAVMRLLQSAGVAAGIVQDPAQRAEEDPQLRDRRHIVELKMNEGGSERTVRVDSLPMTVAALPHEAYRPAPELGEHNLYVYGSLLGMSESEIAANRDRGIF